MDRAEIHIRDHERQHGGPDERGGWRQTEGQGAGCDGGEYGERWRGGEKQQRKHDGKSGPALFRRNDEQVFPHSPI